MKLNETPIRTCNKFNINNIDLQDYIYIKKAFNGLVVESDSKENTLNYNILKKEDVTFKYGLSNKLNSEIIENANKNVDVKFNSKSYERVNLKFNFTKEDDFLKCIINVNTNSFSNGTLVITFESMSDIYNFNMSYIKFNLDKNSNLNVVVINKLNDKSLNMLALDAIVNENSNLNITIIDLGAKNSIVNYYSMLKGKNSENTLNSIYTANGLKLIDLNYISEVFGKNSKININSKGALMDSSTKHFKGTISFEKGAKKAKGNESEFAYILSGDARSLSLPMLLCKEEDVEGEHSASSGKIDKKLLFYLESRGLSEKEATKLVIKSTFNSLLDNITDDVLKDMISEEIDKRIN